MRAFRRSVGSSRFLVTSDGGIITNPRFLDGAQATIKDLQRRRERATRGSSNHKRIRRQLAREWRRIRNQRHDFHHKTARTLVGAYDVISLEELRIGNLTRSAKGTIDAPGTNVAQKAGLNRSILDAAWGQFIRILTAKAEAPDGEWFAWILPTQASTATPAAPSAPDHARTPSCARSVAHGTPTRSLSTSVRQVSRDIAEAPPLG
jgi:putative transposase